MKGLFKSKPRTPAEVVRQTRDLLIYIDLNWSTREAKCEEKVIELSKLFRELKSILYGNSEAEPVSEACAQLTQEFFKENTLRLLITCLPKLNLEARKDATQVVANLQRQQVHSRLIASDYLETNKDVLDTLITGYENMDIALHYGAMLRECIRHQSIARYVLESEYMKKFFDYIELPNFDIASDASATFKELLTRHKSTVAEFLSKNYDWESSKTIQIDAFHVFKLFVANQNKPAEIITILITNRNKLLRLLGDFKLDKEDEQFEADKAQVMKEIASLPM
ncbi:putative MO25-like protein At5g47540 isoform X2 [Dendrobium catenatum]|uniref:putative MO25-like protein At5g47540 isoform X2 n=1 Tax=Dendrobium catenatum TaxID=906689 RepID=UPI0009F54260|nr:putative MO25-like protein At5g47540 isoform X2 [Dendrobium catenatum]